jgi:hypothetical protein
MNANKKPQAINLGQAIDGQSITDNYSDLDRLIGEPKFIFGESSPVLTDRDILEHTLLPDSNYCSAMDKASAHLRSLGYPPLWSREDLIRYHLHAMKRDQLRGYAGVK